MHKSYRAFSFLAIISSYALINDNASEQPKIISKDGEEVGLLSIRPNWSSDRFNPADIKYTCDWD
jgi:hypothetical protein|tara:strand:+ start:659 stop:853 length:195 start_codon:yes stop_codon:yes gene_type:complete